ncbi:MAG: hypothetical protein ACFFD2_03845 [Promethearchaeota archaeon]
MEKKIIASAIILLFIILLVISLIYIQNLPSNVTDTDEIYYGFSEEQKVTIFGYEGDAMEPFISKDDMYLFFNNQSGGFSNKDIFYAQRINDTFFQFKGEVKGVNSIWVDGNPSMDKYGNFYFISTRDYNIDLGNYWSIFTGKFDEGNVTNVKKVEGNIDIEEPGWINMGVEISGDGETLYFSSAFFGEGLGFPTKGNIRFAKKSGEQYIIPENENTILFYINNEQSIQYAGELSDNGLEMFFSQLTILNGEFQFKLYFSNRSAVNVPFGKPMLIKEPFEGNIQAFVEAPTLSQDGKRLYYHKYDNEKFSIFMLSRG